MIKRPLSLVDTQSVKETTRLLRHEGLQQNASNATRLCGMVDDLVGSLNFPLLHQVPRLGMLQESICLENSVSNW